MITEDYVSFETAKLLKEKGFDGQYHMYYIEDGKYTCDDLNDIKDYAKSIVEFDYLHRTKVPAPTQSMTMKWLREVHNIHIAVYPYGEYSCDNYQFDVYKNNELIVSKDDGYITYEQAVEAAIKYCLENLI